MDSVVKTRHGEVRGNLTNGVHTFKGIPYAAPPFGANRLRPPQPVTPWRGVRDALTYGPKTPQVPYPRGFEVILADLASVGEDCLNLNIWSANLASARQPVMVWIPGGAFEFGTAAVPYYDGSRFARDGIVCVTINYRVGADGFSISTKEPPTVACSTRWPLSRGCRRISPRSEAILTTSLCSGSRLER